MVATSSAKMVAGALVMASGFALEAVSFLVFSVLDLLDVVLCIVYKVIDYAVESEWRPCYCSSGKEAITSSGKILLSEQGKTKIVCLCSSKLQLEDISDTLYTRVSRVSEMSRLTAARLAKVAEQRVVRPRERLMGGSVRSTFRINSTIVEMLQGRVNGAHPVPRWSDCDCKTCLSWTSSSKETLYVHTDGAKGDILGKECTDVLFIHGFISSSDFWTETLFPNFSKDAKSRYRLIAVDLLGFGRSPKPTDSLYTLREHIDMIERSVLEPFRVKSFHIVAHSLGCILALALAVKYPGSVKSLTLLAPPYFPVPKGEASSQFVLRQVAPRRVWPPIAFGASVASWYEHISRTVCIILSKHHRLWHFLARQITDNRMRTFLVDVFMCHTHHAAWHTLHNVIFGAAGKMDGYLDTVKELGCEVTVLHGRDDELLPVECSYAVKSRVPRANVQVVEKADHITIVVDRQKAFARELEEIWVRNC
ncbi:probable lysophospholipase BODYGUARD 3 [Amborella trichopoda]|uniref:AB hydrolase-1 domain-containing protein n=1 Tax=Amborella trichopoda TaxID=13333 RepID=W1NQJ2_AMBTC|nr:probable lysophospholipase BODYGUARD 3 [Amborella trichopoda]ERM97713.1 hypothetical protein AMTR_s00121p00083540 [Amborella trichopoda]|eukprot:XP_006830297.1 probable lysophospholipase BODYGUARD 3 [Amborella trichopoda]